MLSAIRASRMLSPGDRVIAGVSGGADSVTLLHILVKLSRILGIRVRAVHVHHGLRGAEADADAESVRGLCETENVPFRLFHGDAAAEAAAGRLSVEEAGRVLRFRCFETASDEWDGEEPGERPVLTALAHNLDDSAETILMQLVRGSGLQGLSGIRPARGRIIRPLVGLTRAEIEEYLKAEGLSWRTDSTNLSDDYTRNRVRHIVMPGLSEGVNSRAAEHIVRAGRLIGAADEYISGKALGELDAFAKRTGDGISVPLNRLSEEPEIVRLYMLRRMLAEQAGAERDLTSRHVEDLNGLLLLPSGKRIDLPYGLTAERRDKELWIGKRRGDPVAGADVPGISSGEAGEGTAAESLSHRFSFREFPYEKGMEIPSERWVKWFDLGLLGGIPEIRTRRTGDYFVLKGGGRKTVKAFMADEKIPAGMRDSIPLAAAGSHAVWIAGYRISEAFKVRPETERVLEIRYREEARCQNT